MPADTINGYSVPAEADEAAFGLVKARYEFAAQHLHPGDLLEVACGSGRGVSYLKSECPQLSGVTGVDPSSIAIEHANRLYAGDGIRFLQADTMKYWDNGGFTNIVSIETIEHLPDPAAFLNRLSGMLRAGGTLVASVPVTPSMDSNPDHYTDFSQTSIRSMARQCDLDEKACFSQLQSFKPQTLMGEGAIGFYKKHPEKLLARIGSTFRNGFQHRFLTVAWTKRS